jgi:DNA-binding protein HU-beta
MTKKELIDIISRKAHFTKRTANEAVELLLSEVGRILSKGENVKISGFGTFRRRRMQGKTVKIPKSEKMVTIKDHWTVKFTPGKRLKRQVSR